MKKRSKKKINTGVLIGVIAIVINIITVTVYVYQTSIMQRQQYASVWPYLEWRNIYNQEIGYYLEVKNNGVGPALIKNVTLKLDGKKVEVMDTLYFNVLGTTQFPHIEGTIENRVLPPGESIKMISIKDARLSEIFYYQLLEKNFELEICYESIYNEQWTSNGLEVIEGICL